jgi:hypothetical protein
LKVRPLFEMRLAVQGPSEVGIDASVGRRIGVVTNGTFSGDRLSGTVMPGAIDWGERRADGTAVLSVQLLLTTEDGEPIAMTYRGLRAQVATDAAYFRIAAFFETTSAKYAWLTRLLAVGEGVRGEDGPIYSIVEVL